MSHIRFPILLFSLLASAIFAGCVGTPGDAEIFGSATGGTLKAGVIEQVGSSTVLPLALVWGKQFGDARGVEVNVAGGGSGKGASELCAGNVDLGDMSRPMKQSEKTEKCAPNGVDPVEWTVAYDGLSVVVSNKNVFVKDLTVGQLADIFQAEGFATTWDQVDPSFPKKSIQLCYPDADSGTYEYFNEAILDEASPRSGNGVTQSPNDNVLVKCLAADENGIGYFGFAYVQQNEDQVRAIKIGGVTPTFESIADGSYTPLSRPIFIYTDGVPTGMLADYFRYVYHPEGGQSIIENVGYVALDEAMRLGMLEQLGPQND